MELLKLPNEEFKEDFRNWLIEQYPKNFKTLSGYEILKSYIIFRYGNEVEFERKDFQFFVSFKREIIDDIKMWLETFKLTFEDYKIYLELFIEDINLNFKSSFEKTIDLFDSYLKSEDFIIEKNEINKVEISNIFHRKIIENRLVKYPKKENVVINCVNCEDLLSEEELNRNDRNKRICVKCLEKYKGSKLKKNILNCINCEDLLSEEELKRNGRNKSICSKCIENSKVSKRKEVILNCIHCECLLSEEELNRKHQYKNICINCLDLRKRDYKKNYKLQNPEKSKEQKRRYKKNRMKRDITFKILHRLRTRILLVLHGKKKAESSMNLLGCTAEHLKKHLEEQFKDDMSWENYGIRGWHIDHIKPCASFDLSIIEEQKECFHYTNLQPLWWYENLAKSDKII